MAIKFKINREPVTVDVPADTPLLWVIRDDIGFTGTKFGCGIGLCGACTVHVNGRATRACITPVSSVENTVVTTIEGLAENGHPLLETWVEAQTPQCGYCQPGQIMQAAAMLRDFPDPTDEQIDQVMSGNLCRCMAYIRIREAIRMAAGRLRAAAPQGNDEDREASHA
ncbi:MULTISPECIES: (2Fe-2S)-binding protein [Microbulbifer]|uniref:(2Fe-2S)-binding protein n=1 Tax=Microbulbifer TaxID=48073 RepID=UPI001E40E5EF|nr:MULTISPECIES: (2Fe-2S)-binding protein [Microbulbifer]UHQ55914.1 (2Fe-2S)-binding protein [Microbulbifer sp. YPW16]